MEDAQFLSELHEIIKQNNGASYDEIILSKASYPYLYHLSEMRQNLVDWIPMTENMRVLERNPECGALTGKLLEKAGTVTCVADNPMCRDIINTRYGSEMARLEILLEDEWNQSCRGKNLLTENQRYDVILLVGNIYRYVTELTELRTMLKPEGRLLLADANRLGLKYFAGCQEEYIGGYFGGIEGYETAGGTSDARSYSRSEYLKMLKDAGFMSCRFYYPYPDYKFPNCIYSDEWLPGSGELADNRRNFDRDRLQLFDESKVYDALIAEGVYGVFANSYLIEARALP